jgi:hypothetical protein
MTAGEGQQPFTQNWKLVSRQLEVGIRSWWSAMSTEAEESPMLEAINKELLLKI